MPGDFIGFIENVPEDYEEDGTISPLSDIESVSKTTILKLVLNDWFANRIIGQCTVDVQELKDNILQRMNLYTSDLSLDTCDDMLDAIETFFEALDTYRDHVATYTHK